MLTSFRFGGAAMYLAIVGSLGAAAPPAVTSLDVRGLQIGKVNTLTFTGTDLLPNPRLLTTARIARQTLKEGAKPERITLEVELAPGTPPGYENWWLVTDNGVSARGLVATDFLPQKPLASKAESLPIALHGSLAGSQVSEVTFTGKAGQQIICEMEAQRLGSKLRPVLTLYGPGQALVASSLPMAALRGDTRLEVALPAAGEYRLQFHDLQYAAAAPSYFRLKIGQWSYADLAFPPAVQRGLTTEVELVGEAGEPHKIRLSSATDAPAVPAPWADPDTASGPQAAVWLSDIRELVEQRTGTAPQALGPLPVAVNGRIGQPDEEDAYELTVEPETEVNLEVAADVLGSPIDAELELRDVKGTRLAIDDDTPDGPDPRLTYKVPKGVTKLIAVVRDVNGNSGPRCIYRLQATTKSQEKAAGFTLTVAEDSHTLQAGQPSVFKVEAARAGYDGPIELGFDRLPDGVNVSGQTVPAHATATLLTLSSTQAWPALITGLRGRGNQAEASARSDNEPLGQFQPWLVNDLALAAVSSSEVAFSAGWGAAVESAKIPLGGKLNLKVKCTRPPGHDGPVRLTMLTSQARIFTKGAVDNTKMLREEKATLMDEDKNAQTAYNAVTAAEAALAAAQKAVAANKDEAAAEALAQQVEAARAALEAAKKSAREAAQEAKNEVEIPLVVPAALPEIPHEIAFKAELLKRDRRTVEAVAYTPVQSFPVVNPLALKLSGIGPVKLDRKAGATLDLKGKVDRFEGAAGDVTVTVAGLPPGVAGVPPMTVKNGATDFTFALIFPPAFKPGDYPGLKISATGKPFGPLQVTSETSFDLKVLPPDPLPETAPPAATAAAASPASAPSTP